MTRSLAAFLLLLVLATAAHGFGLGLGNRFGRLGAIGGGSGAVPPATNFLLANTGSVLLVDAGVKFLIQ